MIKETVQLHLFLHNLAKRVIHSTRLSTRFSEDQTHVGSDGYKLQICLPAKFKLWTCLHVKIVNTVLEMRNITTSFSFTSNGTHFGNHRCFSSQSSSHDALIRSFTPEAHQKFLAMYGFARFWEPRNEAAEERKAEWLCKVPLRGYAGDAKAVAKLTSRGLSCKNRQPQHRNF